MKLRIPVSLAILLAIVLSGCGSSSKLVGTWSVVLPNALPADATLGADGSLVFVAENPMAKTMKIKMSGKYRESGDTVFITWQDVAFENTPEEAKALEGQMKESLKQQLKVGVEQQTKVTWEGDSSFKTTSPEGQVTTFKKK